MTLEPIEILLVEDNLGDAELVREALAAARPLRCRLTHTERLGQAVALAGTRRFDVILLDLSLPDARGVEAIRRLRAETPGLPIVVLTGLNCDEAALEAVRAGAQDYLWKGRLDGELLSRAIRYGIERHRAEQAVRDSEARIRAIVDTAVDGFIAIDERGLIEAFNPAAERMFGYPAHEVLGKNINILMPPPYRDEHDRYLADYLRTGERKIMGIGREVAGRRKDGTVFPIDLAVGEARLGGRRLFTGFVRDLTERQRAQESVRQLASIVESSEDAIVGVALDGTITSWNTGATRTFGYAAEEALGRPLTVLAPSDRADEIVGILARVGQGKAVSQFETVRVRKDGRPVDVSVTVSPVRDASGKVVGISWVVRDITERKRLEEQLRQAQKMEAIGHLAGGVAHDFNNLLTVINGYGDLVLQGLRPGDSAHGPLLEIRRAGERAARLTRQLLAFSRKQILQPVVLDLNSVVAEIEKMLSRLIGEDILLMTSLDPHLDRVRADPGQIEQVLMNLVVNARDAMPRGGRLTIETHNVQLDQAYASIHTDVQAGPYVLLAVSDSGEGMAPEVQARVFEPFFTTKEVGKGTGLGLAVVHGIIKQSGGHITVYSEPGRGTTFKVYLPRAEVATMDRKQDSGLFRIPRGSETILLAEDEEGVRTLVRAVLESNGYQVLVAGDGREAYELARRHHGPLHLLVTDAIMPHLSGRELADQLQQMHPGLRVLYMSGYTGEAVLRHGILEGGTAFLQKPFTPAALGYKVREVLDAEKG